jgi:hypothetical protein
LGEAAFAHTLNSLNQSCTVESAGILYPTVERLSCRLSERQLGREHIPHRCAQPGTEKVGLEGFVIYKYVVFDSATEHRMRSEAIIVGIWL